jgi:hypothetical protein
MMFALWTAVTFLRPLRRAHSKAYETIRLVPVIEIGLIEMPASSRIRLPVLSAMNSISSLACAVPCSNSIPAYRSSWFSRTMMMSTFS